VHAYSKPSISRLNANRTCTYLAPGISCRRTFPGGQGTALEGSGCRPLNSRHEVVEPPEGWQLAHPLPVTPCRFERFAEASIVDSSGDRPAAGRKASMRLRSTAAAPTSQGEAPRGAMSAAGDTRNAVVLALIDDSCCCDGLLVDGGSRKIGSNYFPLELRLILPGRRLFIPRPESAS
jgi:hypothetical protein